MEYDIKHYCRVKYAFICTRQSFLKVPSKDDFEEYDQPRVFYVLNKIDELDGTNDKL